MAFVVKDRVKQETTFNHSGTNDFVLNNIPTGFQGLTGVMSNGDTTYYSAVFIDNGEFEVGLGTYNSSTSTLVRTTILESSNSNNKVSFSSGIKTIFMTNPAEKNVLLDASDNLVLNGTLKAKGNTIENDIDAGANNDFLIHADNHLNLKSSGGRVQIINAFDSVVGYLGNNGTNRLGLVAGDGSGWSGSIESKGRFIIGSDQNDKVVLCNDGSANGLDSTIKFKRGNSGTSDVSAISAEASNFVISTLDNTPIQFKTNTSEALTIDTSQDANFAKNVNVRRGVYLNQIQSDHNLGIHPQVKLTTYNTSIYGRIMQIGDDMRFYSKDNSFGNYGTFTFQVDDTQNNPIDILDLNHSTNVSKRPFKVQASQAHLTLEDIDNSAEGDSFIWHDTDRLKIFSGKDNSGGLIEFWSRQENPYSDTKMGTMTQSSFDYEGGASFNGIVTATGFSGKIHPVNGATTNYLSLKDSNELNFFNSSNVSQKLYINYDGGDVDIAGSTILATHSNDVVLSNSGVNYGKFRSSSGTFTIQAIHSSSPNITYQGDTHIFDKSDGSVEYMRISSDGVGIGVDPANARGGFTDLVIGQGGETGQGSTQPQIELYHSSASWAINNDSTNSNQMGFHYNNGSSWTQQLALKPSSADFSTEITNGSNDAIIHTHRYGYNNSRNFQLTSGGSGGDVGLYLKDAGSSAFVQLYGGSTHYGFLSTAWGNWDLKKEKTGAMDLYGSNAVIRLVSSGNNDRGIEFNHGTAGSTPASGQTKKASITWNEGNANLQIKNFRTDANISYANIGFFTGGGTSSTPALRMNINYAGAIGFTQSGNTTSTNQDPNNMEYGSSGQVLTSNGNLSPPTWQPASSGGVSAGQTIAFAQLTT